MAGSRDEYDPETLILTQLSREARHKHGEYIGDDP